MKIGGKERKIKAGLNQSVLFVELRGINLSDYQDVVSKIGGDNQTGSEIRDLVWSCLKDGARISGEQFPFTNYDVGDWLETLEDGEMEKFIKEFLESMPKVKETKKKIQEKK
ncbi:MAG: hypothetical protein KC589_05055 [Nanoarchaeota archaeon]|nr:hypothetical protein [Nanoarchaeota archaeon]